MIAGPHPVHLSLTKWFTAAIHAATRDREHDLAELLAGLEPLVRGADLGQRHDLVDDRARASARDRS